MGSDLECPHCHPSGDGWPTQAASKVLQPGYKNIYDQDMLRYIPLKAFHESYLIIKVSELNAVSVLIIREEESKEKKQ